MAAGELPRSQPNRSLSINLTVEAENTAAISLYGSVECVRVGLKRESLQVDGKSYDLAYMALVLHECMTTF